MAYESTTLAAIYQQIAFDLDAAKYVPNGKVTAIAAGSITAPDLLQDSGSGSGHWRDMGGGFYRGGSATAADNYRPVGDLTNSTGLLAQTGVAYSDTTLGSENILLTYHNIRPDLDWLPLINQVLKEEYFSTTIALSHLSDADGDMSSPTDTSWTDVGTPTTSAKDTTTFFTPYGMRNYHLVATGVANSGTRSSLVAIGASRYYSMFTIASVTGTGGTASFQPYNGTLSTTTGMPAAITSSEVAPQLMVFRNQQAPSTCHALAMNMLNTSATGNTYWNQAWLYAHDNLVIRLPSYISEHFKAPSIFQMIPRFNTSTTGQSVWNAQGIDMVPLTEGQDYSFSFHQADANPYQVVFADRSAYQWPLFIEAKRPWYDIVGSGAGFVDDTSTFGGSLMSIMPKIELKLLDKLYLPRFGSKMPKWGVLRNQIAGDLAKAAQARIVKPLAGPRPYFHGVGHA